MAKVIPTILTQDPADLENKIQQLTGLADRVQIDIIDGFFLPEKTITPEDLKMIETTLTLDIHLMVKDPESWINRCIDAAADRIIGQVEMMTDQENFVAQAEQTVGLGVGIGLDIETPITAISTRIINSLDLILIMTRRAGFTDLPFDEKTLNKVGGLREMGYVGEICVDGGINSGNINKCVEAGADLLAIGGAIWKAENISESIRQLTKLSF